MYIFDVDGDIVNLRDKDIYIPRTMTATAKYAFSVIAEGPVTSDYGASNFTLWRGTKAECEEYQNRLAIQLDVIVNLGWELGQTTKENEVATE